MLAIPGAYQGRVEDTSVDLWRGAYAVHGLAVTVQRGDGEPTPLFKAERVGISLDWVQLLRGRIRSTRDLDHSRLVIAPSGPLTVEIDIEEVALPTPESGDGSPSEEKPPRERLQDRVGSVVAFRIDSLRIRDGIPEYLTRGVGWTLASHRSTGTSVHCQREEDPGDLPDSRPHPWHHRGRDPTRGGPGRSVGPGPDGESHRDRPAGAAVGTGDEGGLAGESRRGPIAGRLHAWGRGHGPLRPRLPPLALAGTHGAAGLGGRHGNLSPTLRGPCQGSACISPELPCKRQPPAPRYTSPRCGFPACAVEVIGAVRAEEVATRTPRAP